MEKLTIQNPFVVGRYISPDYFCDREQETAFLIKQIENGRNVALISPRRMGKTGLIHHTFHQETLTRHFHTFFVDIYATTSLAEFVYLLGKAIYEELKPKGKVCTERFFQVIASLRMGFKWDGKQSQFIFAGSKRHLMSNMFNSSSKPFYQSAISMGLNPIPLETYTTFAIRLFEERGKHVSTELIQQV